MDLSNLLNPPVLFFFIGAFAVLIKSNLKIPEQVSKFFAMYLLFAIGFKGGHELSLSGFHFDNMLVLGICSVIAFTVPLYSFFLFRFVLDVPNAAALAGSFGSVSAVTFVTAGTFLHNKGLEYGGFIVAGMALMESPAIVIAVILDKVMRKSNHDEHFSWKELLHEAVFGEAIVLLLGALFVGYITGDSGWKAEKFFAEDLFKGFLTFFLLDMGISTARRISEIKNVGIFLLLISLFLVAVNASLGITLSKLINLSIGDALMLTVLSASASYIAVPAAMRTSIPEANPGIYLTVALSVVFPFNIIIGIPTYFAILQKVLNQ